MINLDEINEISENLESPEQNQSESEDRIGKVEFKVEDIVDPNDRVKLSLLNMQKRFVDIEFVISEIVSRLKAINVDELKVDKQRIDDIEDMVLVEQAGIMELQKLLQKVDKSIASAVSTEDVSIVKSRVKRIESLARAAAQMVDISAELPEEGKMRLEKLEGAIAEMKAVPAPQRIDPMEIADIKRNMNVIEDNIDKLKGSLGELQLGMKGKIENAMKGSQVVGVDFDYVNSKLNSIKTAIDILSDKRLETDLNLSGLEHKLEALSKERTETTPIKMFEVVKEGRKGMDMLKIRMESVERVVGELSKNMRQVEISAQRFESFEKLSALQNEVDNKLRQFTFVKDETKRLSNRVEMMYDDLDKRLNKNKRVEREVQSLIDETTEIKKDMDRMNFNLKINSAVAGDVKALKHNMEELDRNAVAEKRSSKSIPVQQGVSDTLKKMNERMLRLERVVGDVKSSVVNISGDESGYVNYESRMDDIVDKLIFLESRLSAIESMFQTSSKTQAVVLE